MILPITNTMNYRDPDKESGVVICMSGVSLHLSLRTDRLTKHEIQVQNTLVTLVFPAGNKIGTRRFRKQKP